MSPAVPQPINGIINTNAGFYMLPEESDHVSVDRTQTLPKTQKRMAQRRLEPIVAKHEKRTRKTNLNSFKEKYLNLKKKLSALQIEVGDFLLIVKNNLQVPSATQQSPTAGKYMIFGAGAIADQFFSTGIDFDTSHMVKMANNHNYEVEPNPDRERGHEVEPNPDKERGHEVEPNPDKERGHEAEPNQDKERGHVSKRPRHETLRRNSQKETHPRNRQRSPPQKKKKIPKKVLTPGSNFLEPSESIEEEEEEESDNREEAQTDDAEERDVNLGFLADTSTMIDCNSA
jgi:hypothetical protein